MQITVLGPGHHVDLRIEGTRQIRVILYGKRDPFCVTTGERLVEDKLAVEQDVIPLDGG